MTSLPPPASVNLAAFLSELLALLLFSLSPSEGRRYCLVLREGDCNPGPCLSLATLCYRFLTSRSSALFGCSAFPSSELNSPPMELTVFTWEMISKGPRDLSRFHYKEICWLGALPELACI